MWLEFSPSTSPLTHQFYNLHSKPFWLFYLQDNEQECCTGSDQWMQHYMVQIMPENWNCMCNLKYNLHDTQVLLILFSFPSLHCLNYLVLIRAYYNSINKRIGCKWHMFNVYTLTTWMLLEQELMHSLHLCVFCVSHQTWNFYEKIIFLPVLCWFEVCEWNVNVCIA